MGVFGWRFREDGVKLVGRVDSAQYTSSDGDWNLKVVPDPPFERLLRDSDGNRNDDGMVECEIEPTDSIGSEFNENHYFAPLQGQKVEITGTWVDDVSHPIPEGKTEIHPITSILLDDYPPLSPVKKVKFFGSQTTLGVALFGQQLQE